MQQDAGSGVRLVEVLGTLSLVDGKICEEWIAEDLLSLMQQLGALPKRLPG